MEVVEEMVTTLRPDGKKGIVMTRKHYRALMYYILNVLDAEEDYTLNRLLDQALEDLSDSLDSDISWYILQIKLDLEARDLIRAVTPVYNKKLFFLKLTRHGQKRLLQSTVA
jgi:hypothetical protein